MSIAYTKYGVVADYTITLASLVNNASRQSTEVENTQGYDDILALIKITTGALSAGYANIWAYSRVDTLRSENAGAVDAAITLSNPPNLVQIGRVSLPVAVTTYYSQLLSIARAFGGRVPRYHGIIVQNLSTGTFGVAGADFAAKYYGAYYEIL